MAIAVEPGLFADRLLNEGGVGVREGLEGVVGECETDGKWNSEDNFVAGDDLVLARVEPFDFRMEAGAHFLVEFSVAVTVNIVVADFPESGELATST